MKYMNVLLMVMGLFFSLHSMEVVPFLKQEDKIPLVHHVVTLKLPKKRPQKLIATYFMKLFGDDKKEEIDILGNLQQKIPLATQYIDYYSDKVKTYKEIVRGGAAGMYTGMISSTTLFSGYGMVDGCMWCWCNATLPKITCCMTLWGLCGCGCIGCITGSCCVATGFAKKMGCGS